MKAYHRLLAFILAALTLLLSCVSCDSDDIDGSEISTSTAETTDSETVTEAETEYLPAVEKKNYGSDFYLSIQPDTNSIKYHWVEESDNDAMSQALFDRQQKVYNYLGVNIIAKKTESGLFYVEPFKSAVKIKDGSVDALMTHQYHGIDGFITGNYLTDYNKVPQINLSADYWNLDIMEDVALHGRMYLGMSKFNILRAFVIAFNKDMMEKYDDALDESVYEMVDNYRWTLDKMIGLANLVYIDTTSDGQTSDDTFGIIGEHNAAFCSFFLSNDISMIEIDDKGEYVISVYNETNRAKTTDIIEKLQNLAKSDSAWFWKYQSTDTVNFNKNQALMCLSSTYQLPAFLQNGTNFGVLPYPMYDENQKDVGYRTLQWGGYLCIPSYVNDIEMVGDTLEVMSFYSEDVSVTFYEKLLGKQASESPQDTKMLEIVWDGIGTDIAQTYYSVFMDTQFFHMMPLLTYEDAAENVASFMASKEKTVNKKLQKFLELVERKQ